MASYTDPPEDGRGRQDLTVAITVLVFSVGILFLPSGAQSRMADFLLGTILRPFVMTQEALAVKTGVTRQTINAIEKDKYSPSLDLAFRIADLFKVKVEDVFQFDRE